MLRRGHKGPFWATGGAGFRAPLRPSLGLRNFSQGDTFSAVLPPDSEGKRTPNATRYAGLGIQLVASVAAFAFVGQWLDRRLGTGGILLILGGLMGFGGTMWSLMRSLRQDEEKDR